MSKNSVISNHNAPKNKLGCTKGQPHQGEMLIETSYKKLT